MATRIRYTGPSGRTMDLLKPGDWHRSIAYGGLSGMIGRVDTSTVVAVGVPGHTPMAHKVRPMEGELTLHVVSGMGMTVEEAVSEIRREFTPTGYGTLHIERDNALSTLSTRARLNGEIAALPEVPEDAIDAEIKVPIISDEGLWAHDPLSATGTCVVMNFGDAFCWPEIRWWGQASLTLPSGVVIPLPWVEGDLPRRVSTDPYTSHEVLFDDGTVDEVASAESSQWWMSEGVPEGGERAYIVSGDARVWWRIKVRDPWR